MNTIRATIAARNQEFVRAFGRGDIAGIAALYTEQAHLLPPGSDLVQGRAAIESFWQQARASGILEVQLTTVEFAAESEQLVCEIGRYVLTIQQGGERVQSPGKYVVLWKQEEGEWKLHVDIWNS